MRRSMWQRSVVAALAVAVLVVGCGSEPAAVEEEPLIRRTFDETEAEEPSGDDASPSATETPSDAETGGEDEPSPPSEEGSAASAEATASEDVAELPEAEGRDWMEVTQALLDIRSAAYDRRDTGLVPRYARAACVCWDIATQRINELVERDLEITRTGPDTVAAVEMVQDDGFGIVSLKVTVDRPALAAVQISNGLAIERMGHNREELLWTLLSTEADPDGPWRMVDARLWDEE